jgi:hypothetical protein
MIAFAVTLLSCTLTGLPLQILGVVLAIVIVGDGCTVTVVLCVVGFVQPVAVTWNVYVTTIGALVALVNISVIFCPVVNVSLMALVPPLVPL